MRRAINWVYCEPKSRIRMTSRLRCLRTSMGMILACERNLMGFINPCTLFFFLTGFIDAIDFAAFLTVLAIYPPSPCRDCTGQLFAHTDALADLKDLAFRL